MFSERKRGKHCTSQKIVKWQISAPFLANRESVGNQSEKRKIEEKQNLAFLSIFRLFEAVHGFSRLVPDRFLTGSRFAKTGAILILRRFWRQFLNDFWRQKTNRFG